MDKITTENISGGLKLAVVVFTIFISLGGALGSYTLLNYRVTQLEKVEAERKSDHVKILIIERDVREIKEKTNLIYNRIVLRGIQSDTH